MNTSYNKALVAAATPIIVWLAARYGLQLQPDEAAALVTLVTTLAVYVVPNKQQMNPDMVRQAYQIMQAQLDQAEHTGQVTVPTIHREEE